MTLVVNSVAMIERSLWILTFDYDQSLSVISACPVVIFSTLLPSCDGQGPLNHRSYIRTKVGTATPTTAEPVLTGCNGRQAKLPSLPLLTTYVKNQWHQLTCSLANSVEKIGMSFN